MKQIENMLVTVMEECSEITQAVSKSLRFGLSNHHPDRPDITNADEIITEFYQLSALITHLQSSGILPSPTDDEIYHIMSGKLVNVAKWQEVSFKNHTLQGNKLAEQSSMERQVVNLFFQGAAIKEMS